VSTAIAEPFRAAGEEQEEGAPPSLWRTITHTVEGRLGLAIAGVMIPLIIVGPYLAPYSPTAIAAGPALAGPSAAHPLGTDQLGRDALSRFLTGGRSVLLVPVIAVVLSFVVGGGLGLLGAYRRGFTDTVIARSFDLVLALPPLLIILVLIAALGTSWVVIVLVIAGIFAPRVGRVVRGAAQAVVTQDYMSAAKARGETTGRILVHELLPNTAATVIANFTLYLTWGIISVATLSFLGLGAQPPSSDWGLMVSDSRGFITINPWPTVVPALGLALLCIGFTLIGDAVTRHLTPEAESGRVEL
jgi:peptide/nickel transport system permease protein